MIATRLYTFVILALTSGIALADQKVTQEDLKLLPPVCKGTQLIREVSGDKTPFGEYKRIYGDDFMHLHHYCWALNTQNKYHKNPTSVYWRGMLPYAIGDLDYVIKNSSPTFVFLPDVYLAKARIYSLQKQNGQAIAAAHKAIETKPDSVRAYTFTSDLYENLGNKANAIKTLESALDHVPDSKPILKRLTRLGVKPRKREPVAPKVEMPPAPASPAATKTPLPESAPPAQAVPQQPSRNGPHQEPPPMPTVQPIGEPTPQNPYCRFCP